MFYEYNKSETLIKQKYTNKIIFYLLNPRNLQS